MDPAVTAAIARIGEDAWTPIRYPQAIWDGQLGCWVSDAEGAETGYTAFASKKEQSITARLIVRRVRDHNTKADGTDELFPVWRYHPVLTDSQFTMLQAEEQHRDHAIVEQLLADWADGPLAHLPSGHFAANAAWLSCAAIAHDLLRAADCLASRSHTRAWGAIIRAELIDIAARLARHGRGRITLHLPPTLAPPGRMDEPVRRRLRPAPYPRGLTSPDPVTPNPWPSATSRNHDPRRQADKPQNR